MIDEEIMKTVSDWNELASTKKSKIDYFVIEGEERKNIPDHVLKTVLSMHKIFWGECIPLIIENEYFSIRSLRDRYLSLSLRRYAIVNYVKQAAIEYLQSQYRFDISTLKTENLCFLCEFSKCKCNFCPLDNRSRNDSVFTSFDDGVHCLGGHYDKFCMLLSKMESIDDSEDCIEEAKVIANLPVVNDLYLGWED